MADKAPDKETTSASTDDLSNGAELEAAELTQVACKHMADSQSLHTIKTQSPFFVAGSSNMPHSWVCVEIPLLSGDTPQG